MVQQTISAALVIAILVSLVKPILELQLSPTNQIHDTAIRIMAVLMGVAGELVYTGVSSTLTAQSAWTACSAGLMDGVFAVAAYHLTTANYFTTTSNTPPATPPVTVGTMPASLYLSPTPSAVSGGTTPPLTPLT